MTFDAWLLFCLTEAVMCLSPGPAVLLVVSTALATGARQGVAASAGILIGNVVYFALSATSLGALLVGSATIYRVITWLGAAYLVWLGGAMLLFPAAPATATTLDPPPYRALARGFVTQIANPKALVFFTALLPQFIDPARPVVDQMLVLGLSSVVIETVVLLLYVAACHGARAWIRAPRFANRLQRVGGLLSIGAGVRLAVTGHATD